MAHGFHPNPKEQSSIKKSVLNDRTGRGDGLNAECEESRREALITMAFQSATRSVANPRKDRSYHQ